MEYKYIIEYYNVKTNKPICYWVSLFDLTTNINYANLTEKSSDFENEIFAMNIINNIYEKYEKGTMSEHTYSHLKEEFFKDILKKDINFKYLNKKMELRKLKIQELKNRI
jgi:hypothetical protein